MAQPGRPEGGARGRRATLRGHLAVLYAGLFFALAVVLLLVVGAGAVGTSHTTRAPGQGGTGGPSSTGGSTSRPHAVSPHGPNVHSLILWSVLGLLIMAVVSLPVGWLVAGRLLRPLRLITATARDISATNLNRRLGLRGRRDELSELAGTLDALFGRLEASFDSQRHFVANAAHELRTPLTAERALLQVALADPEASTASLRSACQDVLALGEQQEHLIGALLTLASSERGIDRPEPFDLAEVARRVLAARGAEAGRRGITVTHELLPAPVSGDPSMVESLVANLVDNALRHNTDADGTLDVRTAMAGGRPSISVSNTGPVVPPGQVGRLFQPFQQLGGERIRRAGGHGLGLAIVAAITQAHGAALAPRARPDGGLSITVTWPAVTLPG
jgi:signal transduction histidine kinase